LLGQPSKLGGVVQASTVALHFIEEWLVLALQGDHPAAVGLDDVTRALLRQAGAAVVASCPEAMLKTRGACMCRGADLCACRTGIVSVSA